MKNILKNVLVIIGTLIGAGFASGKEICVFFYKYKFNGLVGIIITTVLFILIIWKVLEVANNKNIESYNELKINSIVKNIMKIFLLITFFIMIAGFAAFLEQEFYINTILGSVIIVIVCYLTFIKGIEGITKISVVLVPFMIIMLIHICYKNVDTCVIKSILEPNIKYETIQWLVSSIEYVGYNSIILIPILFDLKKGKKENLGTAIISGIIFMIIAIGVYIALSKCKIGELQLEIPIMGLVGKYGGIYKIIFQIVIAISIYTSAVSAGFGFVKSVSKKESTYKILIIVISVMAVVVSKIGFSQLVEILYPIFGLLGIIQIIKILNLSKIIEKRNELI